MKSMKSKTTKQQCYQLIKVKMLTLSIILILLILVSLFAFTISQITSIITMRPTSPTIAYQAINTTVSCEPVSAKLIASEKIPEKMAIDTKTDMLELIVVQNETLPLNNTYSSDDIMPETETEANMFQFPSITLTAPEFATDDDTYEEDEFYFTIEDNSDIMENQNSDETDIVNDNSSSETTALQNNVDDNSSSETTVLQNNVDDNSSSETTTLQNNIDDEVLIEYCKQRAATWVVKEVPNVEPLTDLTDEEINLIQIVVEREVRGEEEEYYLGKLAVANVILNRYRTDYWEFPDTIKEVLYQEGQFNLKNSDFIENLTISELTKKAVNDALNGIMAVEPNVYYFCTVDTAGKKWFETHETLEFYGYLHPHDFYSISSQ